MSSLINISGLAVGLTMGILIFLWIAQSVSYDKFHHNLKDIYVLMQHQERGGEISTTGSVPAPVAASIRDVMPEVKAVARTTWLLDQPLKSNDKTIAELGIYADADFFRIMSFPAKEGDPLAALREPRTIVLTESAASRLFGKTDALGKTVLHNDSVALKVGAIIKDVPENSSLQFDVVLPFQLYEEENRSWIDRWDYNMVRTWVQLVPHANPGKLNNWLEPMLQTKQDDKKVHLFAYPFADSWLRGQFRDGKLSGGRIDGLIMLGIIGVFVLLIACINFMNLATARSERRAREVGVRKTLGATKKQIIYQFLAEALLITIFAMALGMLVAALTLPLLDRYSGKTISFDLLNYKMLMGLLAMGLITGLTAGSYPAFFLSKFNPARVLKGASAQTGRSFLRKGLVTFQFVISIFLMIVAIVIFKQIKYAENRPLGYNQENLLEIPVKKNMTMDFELLKNELTRLPGVKSVSAGSDNLLNFNSGKNGIDWPGKTPDQDFKIAVTYVQYNWSQTAGISLAEGRDFNSAFGADTSACLLNQAAVRKMQLKGPVIGALVDKHTVVGVINDFVYDNPFGAPNPLMIYLSKGDLDHIFVRITNDSHWQQCIDNIRQVFKSTASGEPVEIHFTKDDYQQKFADMRAGGRLVNGICCLAIFISCLGLFGLSSFVASRRIKEIGIRKVLGAGTARIWFLLCQEFLKPVAIAFLLAAPLAAFVMGKALMRMEYHISMSWWMFALAGTLAVIIAVMTVSLHGIKAALTNPVKSLRSE